MYNSTLNKSYRHFEIVKHATSVDLQITWKFLHCQNVNGTALLQCLRNHPVLITSSTQKLAGRPKRFVQVHSDMMHFCTRAWMDLTKYSWSFCNTYHCWGYRNLKSLFSQDPVRWLVMILHKMQDLTNAIRENIKQEIGLSFWTSPILWFSQVTKLEIENFAPILQDSCILRCTNNRYWSVLLGKSNTWFYLS